VENSHWRKISPLDGKLSAERKTLLGIVIPNRCQPARTLRFPQESAITRMTCHGPGHGGQDSRRSRDGEFSCPHPGDGLLFISSKQVRSAGEGNDQYSKANAVNPSPQYRTEDGQLDASGHGPEHENESSTLLFSHGFISRFVPCSSSAWGRSPIAGKEHGAQVKSL